MCWDINYVDSLIYFMKKVEAFEVLRFVFILVLEHSFYTEIFLTSLGVLDLQIGCMIAFWKFLYV